MRRHLLPAPLPAPVPAPAPLALLLVVLLLPAAPARAQSDDYLRVTHVVVPQRHALAFAMGGLPSAHPPVAIEGVRAHVAILGQTATTTLEVALRNPGDRQAEAVLLLPVPDGAAVHGFAFEGAAREPTARLLPREEARATYSEIVRRTRDPALLEFAGHALVRTSVFPVPAGGTQKLRLTYHDVLHVTDDRVDYVLPRSEALDADVPWDVAVELKSKARIGMVYSPSHALALRRHGPRHVTLRVRDDTPGPFRLSYLREGEGVTASLFAYPDPKVGGGYFLLLADLPQRLPEQRMKREVTLVLDTSGSMAGPKLDQVRAAALQVIEGLDAGEAFNIVDYATTVELFAPAPVVVSDESRGEARRYLASLRPRGGTNIHDALVEALRQEPREGLLPLVLFLTDGLPTIGQTSEIAIREAVAKGNPHGRRVFTFGVGHDVNAPLLDRVAETTRATPTYVDPDQDVEVKVAEIFRRLYGPVLAAPQLATVDASGAVVTGRVRERAPATLPDFFEGDHVVVLGQYRGDEPLRFRLEGDHLGTPKRYAFRFDLGEATTKNVFVARLWASRRIAFLVDQIRQAEGAAAGRPRVAGRSPLDDPRHRELVEEILRLSTEFGIMSEYTSFLATEGTDLSDWRRLNGLCGLEIDNRAVRTRWGREAVAQARNVDAKKKQQRLDYQNGYLDENLRRVEITAVQQVCDRSLFKRGDRWIDGRAVAENAGLEPDETVRFGTPRFDALLDALAAQGRAGVLAFKGEILLRLDGRTILVRNDFPDLPEEGASK